MALLDSEVIRLRAELGYNVLTVGAEPYIGVVSIFDLVIKEYTQAGVTTTSSTAIAAAATPSPATLTLASATGFAAQQTVVLDVDSRQERATVQSVSGSTITLLLRLAHTGTYHVTVEGGETIIREHLARLRSLGDEFAAGGSVLGSAGVEQVDEIRFFAGGRLEGLVRQRDELRDELAALLNIPNRNKRRARGGGSRVAVY